MIETFNDTDKVLVRYLFNELEEVELRELEDEMLLDDELFERVQVVEMNLIDGYVRDEMTAEENLRFREKFMAIPENVDKVNHAQMFHHTLTRLHENEPVKEPIPASTIVRKQGWYQRMLGSFQRPLPALAFVILTLFLTFAALYALYPEQSHPANSNAVVANPSPTVQGNVNIAGGTGSNSSVPAGTPSPQQQLPALPSPNKAPEDSGIKIARNNSKRYTQDICLFCDDERSVERSGGDPVPIAIGKKTTHLTLRYELLEDVPEREIFNITIRNRYTDPLKLENGKDRQAVSPLVSKGSKRRRFIIVNVPTSVFKDGGPYTFEIDEPGISPKAFTIKK